MKELLYLKDDQLKGLIEKLFVKDALNGLNKKFDCYGNLLSLSNYANGNLDGNYEEYSNKVLVKKTNYTNGLINGSYQIFYENGSLKEKGLYEMGYLIGEYFFTI